MDTGEPKTYTAIPVAALTVRLFAVMAGQKDFEIVTKYQGM